MDVLELGELDDEELDELGLLYVPELLLLELGFVLELGLLVELGFVLELVVSRLGLLGLVTPELDELVSVVFADVLLVGFFVMVVSFLPVHDVSALPVFICVVSTRLPIAVSARAVAGGTPVSFSLLREHAAPASNASDSAAIIAFLRSLPPM